ncbi:glycerophosphodiester phosphodiesterase [Martelella mediterranea]|nr:glycerophosphodiester phosphodiesterase family protein [Martelella mediterranea]
MKTTSLETWPARRFRGRPSVIAHRGASAYARENTLAAFNAAADLGADMWELDLRLTRDGIPVISHDDHTGTVFGTNLTISKTDGAELFKAVPEIPTLKSVVALAARRKQALYIEVKAPGAGRVGLACLEKWGFNDAVFGSFNHAEVHDMVSAGSQFSISVLVRQGEDPFEARKRTGAGIVHLCWEKASPRPQELVTPELLSRAEAENIGIVLWHEERPEVLDALVRLPVLGICSNQPELIGGYSSLAESGISVVCHRGMNHLAPENTTAAASLAFNLGCEWLELDVRQTADGEIVVMHDPTLERTTDGSGKLSETPLAALSGLDAGGWFSSFYQGEKVQTLREAIAFSCERGKKMYIENKDVPGKKLVSLVEDLDFLPDCIFWSANMQLMDEMRAASPNARLKSNIAQHGSLEAMKARLNPAVCEIRPECWEHEAPLCRQAGITPMLHYFGEDPDMFETIAQWRPEMVNLNRADMLLNVLKERAA